MLTVRKSIDLGWKMTWGSFFNVKIEKKCREIFNSLKNNFLSLITFKNVQSFFNGVLRWYKTVYSIGFINSINEILLWNVHREWLHLIPNLRDQLKAIRASILICKFLLNDCNIPLQWQKFNDNVMLSLSEKNI